MKKWEHAINSMTEEEINNPDIIEKQTSRFNRIAKGSGTKTSDIRQLIKQYKMLKELTQGTAGISDIDPSQGLSQKQMMKLAKKFGKKMRM
jgi:signal recognition particle subunit SRP54